MSDGTKGTKEITYEVVTDSNNKEITKTKLEEKILIQPENKVIEKGTEVDNSTFILIWLISVIVSIIYSAKNKTNNLIIGKIDKHISKNKILLKVILYIFLIIPPIIDVILIITSLIKNSKQNNNIKLNKKK